MFTSTNTSLFLSIIMSIILTGVVYFWKASVEQAATDRLRVLQLEEQLRVQEKLINDMKIINKKGDDLVTEMRQKEDNLNNKLKDLESYLDNQPKDQKQSSDVLKRTIKELSQ